MGGTKIMNAAQETEHIEPDPPRRARLEEIYRRHGAELFGFLVKLGGRRELAEDWLQETFLRAYRGLGSGEPDGGLRAWLFVIARNVAIDGFRKESKIRRLERAAASPIAAPSFAEEPAESAERKALVAEALDELELDERALVLWRGKGLSYRKISAALGCSAPTARRRVAAAIAAFSEALSRRRIREGGDL